jgi:transposase
MKFIQGHDRTQTHLFPVSLDQSIDADSEVRLIDLFVDSLVLEEYGFKTDFIENGRPAYHPSDLLKLYIYGYLNKTRSSRDLEKACKINIEVIWLLKTLQPDHNTISNFRRDNPKAIKQVFRTTVQLAKHFNLIGGKLIAGDSSKFRAQNSKKNNFNPKKIERHIAYIDKKIAEHNEALAAADEDRKAQIKKEIEKQNQRKATYKELEKQLEESGDTQVSTSDPDSRNIMIRNNICEVAYSAQTTVDAKNNLLIDYKLCNTNDTKAMGCMLTRAVAIVGNTNFTALYDKGYYDGPGLKTAFDLGVKTIVAVRGLASSSRAPDVNYNVKHFEYNQINDTYTCPEGQILKTSGVWYQNKNAKFKQYKTKACLNCKARKKCTKSKTGKLISRSQYNWYYERNQKLVDDNKTLYKQRQAIVEHPYGTIKRQWGFSYISTKRGITRASADVGLMFAAYNFRRLINLIGKEELTKYLRILAFWFYTNIAPIRATLSLFSESLFSGRIKGDFTMNVANQLKFTPQ